MNQETLQPRSRGPRLYHKKSRTGCVRCKQRRVKCDEVRPICGGCSRHAVDCVFPVQNAPATSDATASSQPNSRSKAQSDVISLSAMGIELDHMSTFQAKPSSSPQLNEDRVKFQTQQETPETLAADFLVGIDDPDLDYPESRERRLWELRLWHNSLAQAKPFPTPQPQPIMELFADEVPKMAVGEGGDAILYGIMAHSALNMWIRSTDPQERKTLMRLQRTYLSMLLRQQRQDIANLNPSNADAICLSSLKILTHALALIQTLPLEPWQPPIDFLQMGNGVGLVFKSAWALSKEGGGSVSRILTFVQNPPIINDPNETILSDHSALDWILETPPGPDAHLDIELDDLATKSVYDMAIAYICSVQRALDRKEPEFAICRRLGGFAVWVPSEFTQYLIEWRPRAMVVMAHLMSLFLEVEHIWVIGKAGENQIRGIHKNLPMEWSYKLDGLFQKFKKPGESPPPYSGGFGAMM